LELIGLDEQKTTEVISMNHKSRYLAKQQFLAAVLGLLFHFSSGISQAQITPLGDSYTNTAKPAANFGTAALLSVDGATDITYIQFNLASVPAAASISEATLKLYVNAVTTAGTFNVDYAGGAWSESTIDSTNAPALGSAIASDVSVTTADTNQYILVNVTSAVQAWLSGSQANNGIALVANGAFNATFDSKENTNTSHPPELDIAFGGGAGTITGVTTASGSGLTGGGTSGTLNMSLTTGCSSGQVLSWSGSAWVCTALGGGGTITGVTAGTGLTGGGTSGNVTLSVNTSLVPELAANNTFTGTNAFSTTNFSGPINVSTASSNSFLVEVFDTTSNGAGGMYVRSTNGTGINANADGLGDGVYGYGFYGVVGQGSGANGSVGVYGLNPNSTGVYGSGVYGVSGVGTTGVSGSGTTGVYAQGSSGGYGVDAYNAGDSTGVLAGSDLGYAGWFNGNLHVDGTLSKAGGSFKIDHPLDPANKYLYHSFVESPDMMNIYNGVAILDANGEAEITLPEWFQTLNRDFRYQLTCIGGFAPVYIANEISDNNFKIAGGKEGLKISWQVTGIRQDAWANAHRIPVEQDKPEIERGTYLHPDLYGAPEEKGVLWATAPEAMRQWKEAREKAAAHQATTAPPAPTK
jgi:hypothetical protein